MNLDAPFKAVLRLRKHSNLDNAISEWVKTIRDYPALLETLRLDLCKLYEEADFPDPNQDFVFYGEEYIRECRLTLDTEHLGSNGFFLVGAISDADDLVFLSSDLKSGLRILSHEEVFCAESLDIRLADPVTAYPWNEIPPCLSIHRHT